MTAQEHCMPPLGADEQPLFPPLEYIFLMPCWCLSTRGTPCFEAQAQPVCMSFHVVLVLYQRFELQFSLPTVVYTVGIMIYLFTVCVQ